MRIFQAAPFTEVSRLCHIEHSRHWQAIRVPYASLAVSLIGKQSAASNLGFYGNDFVAFVSDFIEQRLRLLQADSKLPIHDNSRTNNLTLSLVWPWTSEGIGWDRVNQRRVRVAQRLQQGWPNPIPRARLYQTALEVEGSYGKVAHRFGVSREEVCHYVTVVKRLSADLVAVVEAEQDPLRQRQFSLRALLRVARLNGIGPQHDAFSRLCALASMPGARLHPRERLSHVI